LWTKAFYRKNPVIQAKDLHTGGGMEGRLAGTDTNHIPLTKTGDLPGGVLSR